MPTRHTSTPKGRFVLRAVYPPLQGVAKTVGLQQPTGHTPSVSPFGLPAPSEREPRALRATGGFYPPLQKLDENLKG